MYVEQLLVYRCWQGLLGWRSNVVSVIFVNENENENGEKRENNEYVNKN